MNGAGCKGRIEVVVEYSRHPDTTPCRFMWGKLAGAAEGSEAAPTVLFDVWNEITPNDC